MMVPAKADPGSHQISIKFEQVTESITEEVVAWLQQTSVFKLTSMYAPTIEAASISNDLSGDVLLHNKHDTGCLAWYLITVRTSDRLLCLVRHLHANSGVPVPPKIDPTRANMLQEPNHSLENADTVGLRLY
ncbi:hypothetical protein L873DRAFT_1466464 [Choiromyces venosus 120613-1]|uniref:Uncharacterized protein n=1 Tax=Choiromyces venosus 120613-1 TaxID=1336337 RepID=A0A3N4JB50_9PEZI|nr:hypothetical protein L873DRAFT_1466464 [Choiromyces venosus 120613-1]